MSDTAVSLLTAPGAAAIAVVEVRGPQAYALAKQLFTPAGKPLPEQPEIGCFWFGTLGKDEVLLSVTEPDAVEVHCHGGPRVVRWVVEQFTANGAEERTPLGSSRVPRLTCSGSLGWTRGAAEGFELLQRAPTLRTASILLDQLNGAFAAEVRRILVLLESDPASALLPLRLFAHTGRTVGRHLIEPWKVVIAGPPNVGKSSLVNALAGYQRAVVSDVAGTTRDAVGVRVAFDGWPVELVDTAGLRDAEGLEAEGIERAKRVLGEADLVLWVLDATADVPVWPSAQEVSGGRRLFYAVNKCDRESGWDIALAAGSDPTLVSAATGHGLDALVADVCRRLVPDVPSSGAAVPFTPRLIGLVDTAHRTLTAGLHAAAQTHLREALAVAE